MDASISSERAFGWLVSFLFILVLNKGGPVKRITLLFLALIIFVNFHSLYSCYGKQSKYRFLIQKHALLRHIMEV